MNIVHALSEYTREKGPDHKHYPILNSLLDEFKKRRERIEYLFNLVTTLREINESRLEFQRAQAALTKRVKEILEDESNWNGLNEHVKQSLDHAFKKYYDRVNHAKKTSNRFRSKDL